MPFLKPDSLAQFQFSKHSNMDSEVTSNVEKMVAACAGVRSQGHRNAGSTSMSSNSIVSKTFFMTVNIVELISGQSFCREESLTLPALT